MGHSDCIFLYMYINRFAAAKGIIYENFIERNKLLTGRLFLWYSRFR